MTINDRIAQIRANEKMTLQAFGDKIGKLTSSGVSKMEKGTRTVSERTIELVCERFNVNENWLRNGEGEMYKENPISTDIDYADFLVDIMRSQNVQVKNLTLRLQNLDDRQLKALDNFLDILEDLENSKH